MNLDVSNNSSIVGKCRNVTVLSLPYTLSALTMLYT